MRESHHRAYVQGDGLSAVGWRLGCRRGPHPLNVMTLSGRTVAVAGRALNGEASREHLGVLPHCGESPPGEPGLGPLTDISPDARFAWTTCCQSTVFPHPNVRSAADQSPSRISSARLSYCSARTHLIRGVEMDKVALIVVEQGSEWPGNVGDCENVVAVGYDKEGPLQRTRQGLDSLRRRGHYLRVAVLACNEATDLASAACRAEVAHELLTAVSAVGFGRLLLSATKHASMQLRSELRSLAGALRQRLRGSSATVSVRFGGAADGRQCLPQRSVRKCLAEPAGPRRVAVRP
jgi:hypothetical protein